MAPAWSWADSVATHGWHHAVLTGIHFSGPFLKLHERRDLKQKPSHTQHVLPTTRLGPPRDTAPGLASGSLWLCQGLLLCHRPLSIPRDPAKQRARGLGLGAWVEWL